jgi:hypothetical protein
LIMGGDIEAATGSVNPAVHGGTANLLVMA